jgi:hypothetical protein
MLRLAVCGPSSNPHQQSLKPLSHRDQQGGTVLQARSIHNFMWLPH